MMISFQKKNIQEMTRVCSRNFIFCQAAALTTTDDDNNKTDWITLIHGFQFDVFKKLPYSSNGSERALKSRVIIFHFL